MAVETTSARTSNYPEGKDSEQFVAGRRRTANMWSNIFLFSTLFGIISLTALMYNVINGAFGYVAVQNKLDPDALVLSVHEQQLLALPNTTASEDDEVLAAGVAADPNAIGFFGYAYYQEHAAELKLLPVETVAPAAESINDGSYPLARPLYLYTSAKTLQEKPQVAAFLRYYLEQVNSVIDEVGYFPASADDLTASQNALQAAAPPADAAATGAIVVAGSSTVYPLTQRLAANFTDSGFAGQITIDNVGTRAGIAQFCTGALDIANASRPMNRVELEACQAAKIEPVELRVGADALAIVASKANSFLSGVTVEQLHKAFDGSAQNWSEVEAAWPQAPIVRFTPGADSGTLDYFVESVFPGELAELPKEDLVALLETNISRGLMRRFENDQPFAERTQANVYQLVVERVVEQQVVETWTLYDSIFKRSEIEQEVATIPNGDLVFRSWLTPNFITAPQTPDAATSGIRQALLGSLWVIFFTVLVALPLGVGAAIYLEEYATDNWLNRLIETNISNLAGVPSIIYGMLGLAIFVRVLEPLTSGKLFGLADPTTANGRTVLSAGLTLALLVLPVIIINAQEAIRAVPRSLREAGYGLGATQWQVIWNHVLPYALPGILTGNILAMSRAIGETAPLVVVGASTFIALDPAGPFSKFTTLPAQIYQWTARPQAEFRNAAAAAILVLLILLLSLNAVAVLLRNRYSRARA